jgi:hypothetical protein
MERKAEIVGMALLEICEINHPKQSNLKSKEPRQIQPLELGKLIELPLPTLCRTNY